MKFLKRRKEMTLEELLKQIKELGDEERKKLESLLNAEEPADTGETEQEDEITPEEVKEEDAAAEAEETEEAKEAEEDGEHPDAEEDARQIEEFLTPIKDEIMQIVTQMQQMEAKIEALSREPRQAPEDAITKLERVKNIYQ